MPPPPPSYRQAQQEAAARLSHLPQAAPELEASLLLCHLLGTSRSHLLAWPERRLSEAQTRDYEALIQRRLEGEPMAHITGEREFWSLSLKVTAQTLIPRPETEILVERALIRLSRLARPHIADLGTGSGAIALALASERPDAVIHATDLCTEALEVADENRERLGCRNLTLFPGSWCQALPPGQTYDLIVSNPPYIEEGDPHLTQGDLPREPAQALISGADGLDAIRTIAAEAASRLKPGGWLLLEHGYNQAEPVARILRQNGFNRVQTLSDLAHQPRMTEGSMEALQPPPTA